jgi:hypothetical protein
MRHKNISFTSEYRFRHIILFLYLGEFLDIESKANLGKASFLSQQFSELQTEYGSVNTDPIQGFENYKDFKMKQNSTRTVSIFIQQLSSNTAAMWRNWYTTSEAHT